MRRGDRSPPPEQSPRLRARREEAEVVAVHDDRVEVAKRCVHILEGKQPHVAHAALPRHLHRAGGDVDRDHLAPAGLELERDPSGADPDVEHASSDEAQRPSLHRGPAANRREVDQHRRGDEPVVALDDLRTGSGEQHLPERVVHA